MKALHEIDHGWNGIMQQVAKLRGSGAGVRVGVLGEDNEQNALKALWNEFGTEHIPERSFLRSTVTLNRGRYFSLLGKGLARVMEGKATLFRVLDTLGLVVANDVKTRVTTGAGIPPPNAPSTIRQKGSSRTLIDTAEMVNSVTHVVDGVHGP